MNQWLFMFRYDSKVWYVPNFMVYNWCGIMLVYFCKLTKIIWIIDLFTWILVIGEKKLTTFHMTSVHNILLFSLPSRLKTLTGILIYACFLGFLSVNSYHYWCRIYHINSRYSTLERSIGFPHSLPMG